MDDTPRPINMHTVIGDESSDGRAPSIALREQRLRGVTHSRQDRIPRLRPILMGEFRISQRTLEMAIDLASLLNRICQRDDHRRP